MATDHLPNFETGSLPGKEDWVQCKASGAVTENDVVYLKTAIPSLGDPSNLVVEKVATNDLVTVFGVAAETKADGELVMIKVRGYVKVKITHKTNDIVVGDALASDNNGGAKEAATAGNCLTNFAIALQATTTEGDEILAWAIKGG